MIDGINQTGPSIFDQKDIIGAESAGFLVAELRRVFLRGRFWKRLNVGRSTTVGDEIS